MKKISVRWKILMLSMVIVLVSIAVGSAIVISHVIQLKEQSLRERSLLIARTVAQIPEVKKHVQRKEGWQTIQPIVENIRTIYHANYIVVMNMERVRFAHPSYEKLGTISYGEDEIEAFTEHTYTSKARGDLGISVRAFTPIMNENHQQVGVVVVGHLLPSIKESLKDFKREIIWTLIITISCGVVGSLLLANHLKKEMFELEPHELTRLLVERTATFHAMYEGVIAIDKKERITIFNEKAKQMMGVDGEVIGMCIREVIPDTRLPEVLYSKKAVYHQEIIVGNRLIVSNRIPIEVNGDIVGAVAIFQDRTEVAKMAEELTGVRAFIEALRVQNHEYMNKLHTIAGLIQLGKTSEALAYVFEEKEEQESLMYFLRTRIRDESVAGLLLSKVSRAKEIGVSFIIDRSSMLLSFPPRLDRHDFVILLGNLIENAFDACLATEREEKFVELWIGEQEDGWTIVIEDNGIGMKEEEKKRIFDYGYTTKDGSHQGIGMHLIYNILKKSDGDMKLETSWQIGTTIVISFSRNKGEKL
ncbi:sensor histidine kinase [Anoxybacillus salavatliensis]|uniref:ATP-binding protein n=1 Tax=Anoxybacillus gonensis TaxID=198467 RepID=UPI00214CF2FC|nr:sensor histidine kinase [Anoxybacillus gonensis]MCQ5365182.1 sensor histidine kinase [Anoxybacillus gonensis]